jgi:hypothetical protein
MADDAAPKTLATHGGGPKTAAGKAHSSANAIRHGLLSRRLFLKGEDPAEFCALFDQLTVDHRPLGTLEIALVEKIAVCLWRQGRLVEAETAQLTLRRSRHDAKVKFQLSRATGTDQMQVGMILQHATGLGEEPESTANEAWSQVLQNVQKSTLIPHADDLLSRYQTSLDNELYKAIRALRDAQAWRLTHSTREITPD